MKALIEREHKKIDELNKKPEAAEASQDKNDLKANEAKAPETKK